MIPPHLFFQIYFLILEQNACIPPTYGKLSEYTDSAQTEVEDLSSRLIWMGQMCMTDADITQDFFILPAPPVGGLPIAQPSLTEWSLFLTINGLQPNDH